MHVRPYELGMLAGIEGIICFIFTVSITTRSKDILELWRQPLLSFVQLDLLLLFQQRIPQVECTVDVGFEHHQ